MDPKKIESIRNYLQNKFPGAHHKDKDDFDREGHLFRITTPESVMLTSISRELIDDHEAETIISKLEKIDLPNLLINNSKSTVVVKSSGVDLEPRL